MGTIPRRKGGATGNAEHGRICRAYVGTRHSGVTMACQMDKKMETQMEL